MDTIRAFFPPKIWAFLFIFKKEQGRPTPLAPSSCASFSSA